MHIVKNFICLFILTMAGVGEAAVIYSAPPNQSGASDANCCNEADNFSLAGSAQVTSIKFWTFQGSAADYAGSIAWSINNDAAGLPGSVIASGSAASALVATGVSAFGLNEFSYLFSVNVALTAGTTYWLVLHNGPTNATPGTDFFWEWSNGNTGNSQQQDLSSPGQPWLSNFSKLAFEVQVPEPTSMLLLGAGLLAVLSFRIRKSGLNLQEKP